MTTEVETSVFTIEVKEKIVGEDGKIGYGETIYEQTVTSLKLWEVIKAVNSYEKAL